MQFFSRSWLETASLYWSWRIVVLLIVFGALFTLSLITATAAFGAALYMAILGSVFTVALLVFYGELFYYVNPLEMISSGSEEGNAKVFSL